MLLFTIAMAIQREVSQPPTAPASGEAYDPAATTQQSSEAVLPASENTRTDALLKEEGVGVGRLEKAENGMFEFDQMLQTVASYSGLCSRG